MVMFYSIFSTISFLHRGLLHVSKIIWIDFIILFIFIKFFLLYKLDEFVFYSKLGNKFCRKLIITNSSLK